MKLSRSLFSSRRQTWETPQDLLDRLNEEFRFIRDVCATGRNRKCVRYFSPDQNALRRRWRGVCWMNPPYGRGIGEWVRKAFEESLRGATVVALLPARSDTAWWHDYVMKASEIRLLRGRLRFVGAKTSAPFPSAVVVFSLRHYRAARVRPWDWKDRGSR